MALKYGFLSLSLIAYFASTAPAAAYLDPGTGSIILQGLIGAVAGGLVVMRLYWSRLKSFFRKEEPETNAAKGEQPDQE